MLICQNLSVYLEGKQLLKNINLTFASGQTHLIMGANGSGKSTFSQFLAGNPIYTGTGNLFISVLRNSLPEILPDWLQKAVVPPSPLIRGKLFEIKNKFGSEDIQNNSNLDLENSTEIYIDLLKLTAPQRFLVGVFVSFQDPIEIDGVSIGNFLKTAMQNKFKFINSELNSADKDNLNQKIWSTSNFLKEIKAAQKALGLDEKFYDRFLNFGLSGGEKKKAELLQLLVFNPSICLLDEIDSGLDIKAVKIALSALKNFMKPTKTLIIISHNPKILNHLKIDTVTVLNKGEISMTGGAELVGKVELGGFG